MTPHVYKVSSEAAWLARWKAGRNPACALLECLYDDVKREPERAAFRELHQLEPDFAVSGVVRWIFCELVRICASESLRKAEDCLNGLRKLIRCTGGLLSAELTHFIRVGLAELDREVRSRR
jgi:hypothetical protein